MIRRLFAALFASLVLLACVKSCQQDPNTPQPPDAGTGGIAATGGAAPVDGGIATGGKQSPTTVAWQGPRCRQGMMAAPPDAEKIAKWKRTLGPPLTPKAQPRQLLEMMPSVPIESRFWPSNRGYAVTQNEGSCTGRALTNCVSTQPFKLVLTQTHGLKAYEWATTVDPWRGQYPPDDTGSNGASACKALVHFGWARSCLPTFYSLTLALQTVQTQPITWGVNWHASMYATDSCGLVTVAGVVDGGHQTGIAGVEIARTASGAIDYDASLLWSENSWGNDWGACIGTRCGYYAVTLTDAQKLIAEGAEFDAPSLGETP